MSCLIGAGLRPVHYPHLLERPRTRLRWFEGITENFMDSEGRPLAVLEAGRRDYPGERHGVSLSIGSADGPRPGYLERLKRLVDRIEPMLVSDHLCWTGTAAGNLHDLLPLPLTDEALSLVAARVSSVQEFLGRPLALENVSSYLRFPESSWSEAQFLAELARRTGCKILLDINNVFVNASNHGLDAAAEIAAIPAAAVAEIHLAGFSDCGSYLFDTHSRPVDERVWSLFRGAIARLPGVPVLLEWDEDIPDFATLEREALKAAAVYEEVHGAQRTAEPAGAGAR